MMTTNQIRKKFLDFFASQKKGHKIVPSASLVPPESEDKTVLFTTAGMQQFKRQFLGHVTDYRRAATCQKCLRTDDLDKIGKTNFHHTFFEMLGNFSFGDYFKKEAIAWAWEFLTKELKIPAEKLWVSVYKDDKEAKDIWIKEIGINPKKLVELGDHSNFWPADAKEKGPNGPCGPCSEIFYDYGVNPDCPKKEKCNPDCSCGRFAEIWNLVFTQFNRKDGGVLEPLPNKNIDTGMGLERLAAVVQGKKSNFETDLFVPILEAIDQETNAQRGKYTLNVEDKRIIADHIRAIVFGITDGVMPSNEGRGYVIKRLIIDATDKMIPQGKTVGRLYELVNTVAEIMREPYPELSSATKLNQIRTIIREIQEAYLNTRNVRLPELKEKVQELKKQGLPDSELIKKFGELMFSFRDTFGLTLSTIQRVLLDSHVPENISQGAQQRFGELMKQQQEKSRAASKMTGDVFADTSNFNVSKTKFLGYEEMQAEGKILKIVVENNEIEEVKEGQLVKVILDQTPFYAEGGGQVGDSGYLVGPHGTIRVEDTQKKDDVFIHFGKVEKGSLKKSDRLKASVDKERRFSIMRNHTATHLLQAALRHVLGSHIQQQGSLVDHDRLRFDFTHPKALTKKELREIENHINACIRSCDPVTKQSLPIAEARKSGALAFFAEKYGEVVRVVSVGNYSKEFCGGTHLDFTGQIGVFKITGESAIAQGIRRLEAKTGVGALKDINQHEEELEKIAETLKTPIEDVGRRLAQQTARLKRLEKELHESRFETVKNSIDTIIAKASVHHNVKLIHHLFEEMDMEMLRKISDLLKQKCKSVIIVLGAREDDNASLLLAVSDDVVKRGIKANELIKELATLIDGRGGGRPELAQAGSKAVGKIEKAVQEAAKLIQFHIKP